MSKAMSKPVKTIRARHASRSALRSRRKGKAMSEAMPSTKYISSKPRPRMDNTGAKLTNGSALRPRLEVISKASARSLHTW